VESDGRKLTLRAVEPRGDGRKAERAMGRHVDLHLLDALPEAVIITKATREIRAVNKLACESLRCEREALVGRSLDELILQQMRPMGTGGDRATLSTATSRYDEWSFLLQLGDGKRQLFDVREARLSLGGETCLAYTLRPAALLESSAIAADQSGLHGGGACPATGDVVRPGRGRLRTLLDIAPLGYQVLDAAGRFLDVNQTWLDQFACTRDEITGRRFADMMPLPFVAQFHEFYERLKRGDGLLSTEVDIITDSRGMMTVAVEGKIERDAVGGFRYGHFTVRDITASKRVEAELRQSRESYKHLADSISDVFLALDDGLIVRYWNRTAETLSGRPAAEVVGRHVFDVLPSLRDTDVERLCREALTTQQPITRTLALPHDDGERYYEATAYPAGEWLTVIARDVTESRRAERDLRESEERFRTAFQTAPDAVNLNRLDDGLYVSVNEGFTDLTGYTPEDVVGRSSLELNIWHVPEDRERLTTALRERGQVRDLEAPFRTKDGSVRTGLMSARVVPIGGVPHVLSITRDITSERRALDALSESEERFRTAFFTSPEGMFIDRISDGVLVDVNLSFTTLTGFERDDVVGRTSQDVRLWCDERDRGRMLDGLRAGGSVGNLQTRFRLKNGGTRIGLLSARIITLYGEPHTLSAIRDITDREGVREALAQSEERFRHLFDSLHSSLITVVASDEGREFLIRDINEAGEQMNGVVKADVVGRSITEALPGCRSLDLVALLRDVDRKGHPVGVPLFHCDDGRMSWWAEGYAYRLPSREIVLIIDNVSTRVRTAGALKASEQMYRSLVETMTEGLAARDERHNLTYVNDSFCAMVGYDRDELLGMNMARLLDSRNLTVFRDQLQTQLRGGGQSYELQLTRKDGRTVTAIVSPTCIRGADGEETGAFAVYTDITERKQAEERLRQATMQLDREHLSLQDKNAALKEILAHLEDDKLAFRESLLAELAGAVSPELAQLRHKVTGTLRRDVEGVENGLKRVLAAHVDPFRTRYANLSAREAQVCDLIVSGLSSKEISEQLHLSLLTVHKHRESIRKKLGLQGKDVNLNTFLRAH
jgi:PAS domain S-box-containing protein